MTTKDSDPGVAESGLGVGETLRCAECGGDRFALCEGHKETRLVHADEALAQGRLWCDLGHLFKASAPPSPSVRPPQTIPDQVLTPLSDEAENARVWLMRHTQHDSFTPCASDMWGLAETNCNCYVREEVDKAIAAIRAPLEAERDWLIKQRDAMLARGFIQPCFLDTAAEIPDKCVGATYQCFYCKKWWCDTHAGGHFETEPAALAGVPKEAEPEPACAVCGYTMARGMHLTLDEPPTGNEIAVDGWHLFRVGVVAAPVEDAK